MKTARIAPSLLAADFARLAEAGDIERHSITSQEVTLYLAQLAPGQVFQCRYRLYARYPLRVTAPKAVVYRYYSPHIRAESGQVQLAVHEK